MSTEEEFFRLQNEYWRQVGESEGFDVEDVSIPESMTGRITGLLPFDCQRYNHYPYPTLVNLYAKMGLLRYNILKGTDFQLDHLSKFNMLQNLVSSYFITLIAHDRKAALPVPQTFQVRVDEQRCDGLDLTVSIARTLTEATPFGHHVQKPFIPHFHGGAVADGNIRGELPDWPSDGDLRDIRRFLVMENSEWQDTWIPMYLDLVLCSNDRSITNRDLSRLNIVKVAIETSFPSTSLNARLRAEDSNVYIWFNGLKEVRAPGQVFEIGVDVRRKAIINRITDSRGYMTLVGKLCGGGAV